MCGGSTSENDADAVDVDAMDRDAVDVGGCGFQLLECHSSGR